MYEEENEIRAGRTWNDVMWHGKEPVTGNAAI